MALPDSEDLVYRGINTGNAESMVYRGWIVTTVSQLIVIPVLKAAAQITRILRTTIEH